MSELEQNCAVAVQIFNLTPYPLGHLTLAGTVSNLELPDKMVIV